MSDVPGSGGGDDAVRKRRRRRRRGGGGVEGGAPRRPDGADQGSGGGTSSAAGSGGAEGSSGRRRRSRGTRPAEGGTGRETRERPDEARPARGASAPSGSGGAAEPAAVEGTEGRKRRRRRGPDSQAKEPRPGRSGGERSRSRGRGAGQDQADTPAAAASGVSELDDGWDSAPAAPASAVTSQDAPTASSRSSASAPPMQRATGRSTDHEEDADDDALAGASEGAVVPDEEDDPSAPQVLLEADLPAEASAEDPDRLTGLEGDTTGTVDTRTVRNVCGVRFATSSRVYLFDAGDCFYEVGEEVVVDSDRGTRMGIVASAPQRTADSGRALKRILRFPNDADHADQLRQESEAKESLASAKKIAKAVRLGGKVFRTEAASGNKLLVHVTSEDRLDTREFARLLASETRARIEVRQTGVRDEAKAVGGIGSCGRELCCTTWLPEFVPVSIKMAKDQGLVLNPTKVSGQCGRLKCCLVYEQDLYAKMRKGLPKLGKRVVTEAGEGRVVEVDVLRQRIRVALGPGQFQVFPADEVKPMFPPQKPTSKPRE